jgi:mono/diheme cytochrome c family protein
VRKSLLVALSAVSCLASASALATGDAKMGAALAQQWCISCHAQASSSTASDSVPSLTAAVQKSGRTPEALGGWLANPHGQMPNLSLTRSEIDDLVAYLMTLRSP